MVDGFLTLGRLMAFRDERWTQRVVEALLVEYERDGVEVSARADGDADPAKDANGLGPGTSE